MSDEIKKSWHKNAEEWVKIIQNNAIPSRKYTNTAILDTLKSLDGDSLADIGCGEGWLSREMHTLGWKTTGVDAIPGLIEQAKKQGNQSFEVFTFEDIIDGKAIPNAPFDVAVFNFCLYLKDGTQELLSNTLKQLKANGTIVIQTLHPYFLIENGLPYQSQWLSDSWKGLPGNFTDGHSWYARTMEDWIEVLNMVEQSKFSFKEILNNEHKPISLIIEISKI